MPEPVIDEIIEQELETIEHLEKVLGRLDVSAQRLRVLARRVYVLRTKGKLTKREARKMFVKGFVLLSIAEWAHDVPKVKALTDKHMQAQLDAVEKLDKPLSSLRPIRDIEIKSRLEDRRAKK
jgi:hypothetical protein